MELQYQIESRIGKLQEAVELCKNDLHEYSAGGNPKARVMNQKHSYISKLYNQIEILEEMLQGYKPEVKKPEPIAALPSFLYETGEGKIRINSGSFKDVTVEWNDFKQTLQFKPQPILPMVGIQERTPEENDEFHSKLIIRALDNYGVNSLRYKKGAYDTIKKMNQYFVCIASLQWVTGQIQKFEQLETILSNSISGTSNPTTASQFLEDECNFVDTELTRLHAAEASLAENCSILEKELGITNE